MTRRRSFRALAGLTGCALLTLAAACGGSGAGETEFDADDDRPAAAAPLDAKGRLMAMESFAEPLDPALADQGAELFRLKGCIACHTIGSGRLVGPDLAGVAERRSPGWMAAQILNPDSMIRNDPVTRELFAEYMTPMSNQGLTADETRAVLEFLRRDAGGS